MLGVLRGRRLSLEEVHRFPQVSRRQGGSLTWDFNALMTGVREGLVRAAGRQGELDGVSVTAWGVDYVLFDRRDRVMRPVFHYRDARTARGMRRVHAKAGPREIFAGSGIQFMPLNTLYQLAAETPARRRQARRILLIADAVAFLLSGRARTEESAASTTALYDPRRRTWSRRLLRLAGWPAAAFGPVVPSGSRLGPLRPALRQATGLQARVIASCSHDTACAVAAVPAWASGGPWAYLSSGTWSLMGVERSAPVFSEVCQRYNFTNEMGVGGSIRLLKNIIGLWLVQECRRAWAGEGRDYDYASLTRMAGLAPPFASLIHPGDARFLAPDRMPERMADFCRETGQPVPRTPGAFVRCALESLALIYRQTLLQLQEVTGRRMLRLHIVGGGSRNDLLNQWTADALGIPVVAGPEEATAAGNILVQALALGHLPSLPAARAVVRGSFRTRVFSPGKGARWQEPIRRFESWTARVTGQSSTR